jgi:hypothetical protein
MHEKDRPESGITPDDNSENAVNLDSQ